MLIVDGLTKRWPDGSFALQGVSFTAAPGQIVALIGPSGAGKTTLLRVIAGLETFQQGTLDRSPGAVGMVFQQPSLWPHLTLLENVALPLRVTRGFPREESRRLAAEELSRWGLAHRCAAYPSELSGGEQQRGAIVRTLMLEPEVLCLDEITSALDPEITSDILRQILELKGTETIVLLSTHQLAFARQSADLVLFLDGGKVIEQGSPASVLDDPRGPRTRQFMIKARQLLSGLGATTRTLPAPLPEARPPSPPRKRSWGAAD